MLTITGYTDPIEVGQTVTLTAEINDLVEGDTATYTWSTGETTTTVEYSPTQAGSVEITCNAVITRADTSTENVSDSVTVVAKDPVIAVTGITISPANFTGKPGDVVKLTALITPANATDKTVTWSKTGSVTIVSNGLTATATITQDAVNGSAQVTATQGTINGSANITIDIPLPPENDSPLNREFYVHFIEHRNQGSVAVPYWVLDEINEAIKTGVDWTKPRENGFKFNKGVQSIVDAINTYDSVLVRGSRNGRTFILTKDDLPGTVVPTSL